MKKLKMFAVLLFKIDRVLPRALVWVMLVTSAVCDAQGQTNLGPNVGEIRLAIRTTDSLITISSNMEIEKRVLENANEDRSHGRWSPIRM
jgi:hypothetical protein